jgi:uncharacterized protein (DUF1697 family)
MPKYVAFLRAVNVGGRVVKMEALRRTFAAEGFSGVETFIASGNVVFSTPARDGSRLERRIEKALAAALGFHVAAFVRPVRELVELARRDPFGHTPASGTAMHIGFLKTAPSAAARAALMSLRNDINDFHVEGREVFWLLRGRWSDAGFSGATLEKTLGVEATLRNATTVRRLAAIHS